MPDSKKGKDKTDKNIVICVCGLAGSGKSTLAKKLARKYGLKYFSGGDVLKAIAIEQGYKPLQRGWWESPEGMRFLQKRGKDPAFDEEIDSKLVKLARLGNVVLDSWTMPWLLNGGFKIWLEASTEKRAERIVKRDGISFDEALRALRSKEAKTKQIYRELYGFDLGDDYSPFHLILDTDILTAKEVFRVLCTVMECSLFCT